MPAIGQRQLDVFKHREIADQVEALEDETDLAIADAGALRVIELRHRLTVEREAAFGRGIEQAENREQRGLAATRRSGDRNVFALLDVEMNAGERVRLDFVGEEDLGDAFEFDETVVSGHWRVVRCQLSVVRGYHSSPIVVRVF